MEKLQLKVFNVGHGLSIMFRELPEEYITLIDLGADNQTSPLEYLRKRKLKADQIFITHPHGDHISEIEKLLIPCYRPNGFNIQEYDWDDVVNREQDYLKEKVRTIKKVKAVIPNKSYSGNASFDFWCYKPEVAKENFGESNYINNTSIGGIFTWKHFKIAILGDLETDALNAFCKFDKFVSLAKNTDIFIAPHHGHESGFPELWVEKIGKPYITIASIKESDPHICKKYNSSDFNKGLKINDEMRYCLTTRSDGTITVDMYYSNNEPKWKFSFE